MGKFKKHKVKNSKRKINKKSNKNKTKEDVKLKTSLAKKTVSQNWLAFAKMNNTTQAFKISMDKIEVPRKPSRPRPKKEKVSKVIALDCEMVSNEKNEDMLARVSLVNFRLECVYDKYVKPTSPVFDYRTRYSGIRPKDLENACDFDVVQKEVKELLHNKILVGHALVNDFNALKFGHHRKLIRDSSTFYKFKEVSDGKTPSLKKLLKTFLNEDIQTGEHNSIEDAKAAMKLYITHRQEWEKSIMLKSDVIPEKKDNANSNALPDQ